MKINTGDGVKVSITTQGGMRPIVGLKLVSLVINNDFVPISCVSSEWRMLASKRDTKKLSLMLEGSAVIDSEAFARLRYNAFSDHLDEYYIDFGDALAFKLRANFYVQKLITIAESWDLHNFSIVLISSGEVLCSK